MRLRRLIHDRRGQAALNGFFMVLIFILIVAGLVDVYNLTTVRSWAYRAAEDASLRGAAAGRDWAYLVSTGLIRLDSTTATYEATSLLNRELALHGLAASTVDIRVIAGPGGGTVVGYPPLTRANIFSEADWTETDPAVGVYVVIPVSTTFFGLINGGASIDIHVFAASAVS